MQLKNLKQNNMWQFILVGIVCALIAIGIAIIIGVAVAEHPRENTTFIIGMSFFLLVFSVLSAISFKKAGGVKVETDTLPVIEYLINEYSVDGVVQRDTTYIYRFQ